MNAPTNTPAHTTPSNFAHISSSFDSSAVDALRTEVSGEVIAPGDVAYEEARKVYNGMIVGEHVRPGDLDVNACKSKKLTNMRTTATDENIKLEPPREVTLELALEFIEDDELIEVTPERIGLRKRYLDPIERKKAARKKA